MARMLFGVGISLFLSACTTTLTSTQVNSTKEDVPGGILYSLPATAIEASMGFLPTSCRKKPDDTIVFDYEIVDPVIKSSLIADANQQFVFNYNELNSKMKITSASVALYSNGTLRSINADVDDRTTEVINAVGGMALNLVKASVFVPSMAVSESSTKECSKVIQRPLEKVTELRKNLAKARADDKDLQDQLDELEKAKAALTAAKAKLTASPNDAPLKADVDEKAGKVTTLETATKGKKLTAPAVQADLNKALAVIVARTRVLFAPQLESKCEIATVKGSLYLNQLIDEAKDNELSDFYKLIDALQEDHLFKASVCVQPAISISRTKQVFKSEVATETSGTQVKRRAGIVYREPVMARVVLAKPGISEVDYSAANWVSVPQFGTLATLDLENGPFDKNTLKVTFAEDGGLSTLDFTAQAAAERGAVAAQNLSKTYLDIVTARENAKVAREKAASDKEKKELSDEIAQYESELKLFNSKAALTTAQNGKNPVQSQIDATELETSLVKKQIELEKARAELEKLKAGTP